MGLGTLTARLASSSTVKNTLTRMLMKKITKTSAAVAAFTMLIGLSSAALAQAANSNGATQPDNNRSSPAAGPTGAIVQPVQQKEPTAGTGTGISAGDTSGAVSDTTSGGTAAGTYAQGNSGSDHRGASGWFGLLGLLGLFGLRGNGRHVTTPADTYSAPEVKTRL
jgi:MYXO-CTERM domain-containing protein